jgi:outer membrane protein assembly factor BamB
MRRLAAIVAVGVAALVPTMGTAQQRGTNTYAQPRLPDREELNRLNLRQSFSLTLPMDGPKDGVATMQLDNDLLIVQLRSGVVAVYDAETGASRWITQPGKTYPPIVPPVGTDDRWIIVSRDVHLHAYTRATGQLEWSFELPSVPSSPPVSDGDRLYITISGNQFQAFNLPVRPTHEVVKADDLLVDVKKKAEPRLDDKVKMPEPAPQAYPARAMVTLSASGGSGFQAIASIAVLESVIPPFRLNSNTQQRAASIAVLPSPLPPFKLNSDVQATPSITVVNRLTRVEELSLKHAPVVALSKAWTMALSFRVTEPAVPTVGPVIIASTGRRVIAANRLKSEQLSEFTASGNIVVPMGSFGNTIFVGTSDANVYAFDGLRLGVLWTYTTDAALVDKPMVAGSDLYLTTIDSQLYRLARENGESAWKDSRGNDRFVTNFQRFVAANTRFIYGIDKAGQLTVIGRDRGSQMQKLDTNAFTSSLLNDQTDRIYLASNTGTMICLHDRDVPRPIRYPRKPSTSEAPPPPAAEAPKPKLPVSKPKEAKPKEDKPKDDAAKEDKPKEAKPKEDKPKDDAAKEDKPKDK